MIFSPSGPTNHPDTNSALTPILPTPILTHGRAARDDGRLCELKPGDRVITSPLTKPVVGMKVRLREEQIATSRPCDPLLREPAAAGHTASSVVAVTTLGRGHGGR